MSTIRGGDGDGDGGGSSTVESMLPKSGFA